MTHTQKTTKTILVTSVITALLTSIFTVAISYMFAEYKANKILEKSGLSIDKNGQITDKNDNTKIKESQDELRGFPDVSVGDFAENDLVDISKKIGDMLWIHPNGKIFKVWRDGTIVRVISPGHREYKTILKNGYID